MILLHVRRESRDPRRTGRGGVGGHRSGVASRELSRPFPCSDGFFPERWCLCGQCVTVCVTGGVPLARADASHRELSDDLEFFSLPLGGIVLLTFPDE